MGKRDKSRRRRKPNVDYRHRWPTQQTLIESGVLVDSPRFKWRWKPSGRWLRRLGRSSSSEPGKSTHPYDTGVGAHESESEPSLRIPSPAGDNDRRRWKPFARVASAPPPPAPTPASALKISHDREESGSETLYSPIQHLRQLANYRKSPMIQSPTPAPAEFDKATLKSTESRVQTPPPPTPSQHIQKILADNCPIQHLRQRASHRKSPVPRSHTTTPSDIDKPTVTHTSSRAQETLTSSTDQSCPPVAISTKTLADHCPIQHLRHLAAHRKSPVPRSRTVTPSDFDAATIKSPGPSMQAPVPPAGVRDANSVEKKPIKLADRFELFVRRNLR
ncbi:hypothetical protein F4808DRAFT_424519 [Astrocystis sublimbata]|nr:hypothetical protein F4808DRAFT_424519 [Astrocystis sublimbata]